MTDEPDPEQLRQSPEPNQTPPESPLMGMFERWNKESALGRPQRTYTVEEDTQREVRLPFESKEIAKNLANGFIEEIRKVKPQYLKKHLLISSHDLSAMGEWGNHHVNFHYYPTKDNSIKEHIVEEVVLPQEDQFLNIEFANVFNDLDNVGEISIASGPKGTIPILFVGSDGDLYQVQNGYKINPNTGFAYMEGQIWSYRNINNDDGKNVDKSNFPKVDFAINKDQKKFSVFKFERELGSGDFEQLGSLLFDMQNQSTGGFKYTYD